LFQKLVAVALPRPAWKFRCSLGLASATLCSMQPEYAVDGAKLGWLNQPGMRHGHLRIVLRIDPNIGAGRARLSFESHLSRARWMTEQGDRHLLRGGV